MKPCILRCEPTTFPKNVGRHRIDGRLHFGEIERQALVPMWVLASLDADTVQVTQCSKLSKRVPNF